MIIPTFEERNTPNLWNEIPKNNLTLFSFIFYYRNNSWFLYVSRQFKRLKTQILEGKEKCRKKQNNLKN